MSELQVGFLYKAASLLPRTTDNQWLTLLRSYYLMHCKVITKGFGLPDKHFSSKVRCYHCCIEWKRDTLTKVKSIKLSKTQRRRIRAQKVTKKNIGYVIRRKRMLHGNQMEKICSFCKLSTITTIPKTKKLKQNVSKDLTEVPKKKSKVLVPKNKKLKKLDSKVVKRDMESISKSKVNVYNIAKDVFSLSNKNNTIQSVVKEVPKVITNNKKKRDKFAGLCQKAVLASAKLNKEKSDQNKLSLFLKPST